ncbi:hypothetical protein GQX74_011322 [Glossina fuscipes]|nr:hypothetical protein GQX74_011322 [Glossina fuscipes]
MFPWGSPCPAHINLRIMRASLKQELQCDEQSSISGVSVAVGAVSSVVSLIVVVDVVAIVGAVAVITDCVDGMPEMYFKSVSLRTRVDVKQQAQKVISSLQAR